MSPESLELLLRELCSGDPHAAERIFLTYEPYLRKVVRRQLRPPLQAKFDSADVVQSIWADLLTGFRDRRWAFEDVAQLRAFLLKATRNRFLDRVRQAHLAVEREQPLHLTTADHLPAAQQPRPSEYAQADDIWAKMLALCPPEHHEVLQLRRQGLTRVEIAARTGLHEGSVRRILRRLAREIAFAAPNPSEPPDEILP
jgi:RNA polymerase sigma-70 factor (ECF subfamily)